MDIELKTTEEFKMLNHENKTLKEKANQIDRDFYRFIKGSQKPALNVFSQTMFRPNNKSYDKVRSHMDFDHINQQLKTRQHKLQTEKQALDLRDCTFRPKINSKTAELLNGHYIPAHKRPLPKKPAPIINRQAFQEDNGSRDANVKNIKRGHESNRLIRENMSLGKLDTLVGEQPLDNRNCLTDEEWQDRAAHINPDDDTNEYETLGDGHDNKSKIAERKFNGRRFNPNFYEEKYMWKNAIYRRLNGEKLLQTQKEFTTFDGLPLTNKITNKKMLKEDKDFFLRLKEDLIKSKNVMDQLNKKYYNYNFQPQITINNSATSQYHTFQPQTKTDLKSTWESRKKEQRPKALTPNKAPRETFEILTRNQKLVKDVPFSMKPQTARAVLIDEPLSALPIKKRSSQNDPKPTSDHRSKEVVKLYLSKAKR